MAVTAKRFSSGRRVLGIVGIPLAAAAFAFTFVAAPVSRPQSGPPAAVDYHTAAQSLAECVQATQNTDGGFGAIPCLTSNFLSAMYGTYYSEDLIRRCNGGFSDIRRRDLQDLLAQISDSPFLISYNNDDVTQLFYYTELCAIADFDIPEKTGKRIVSYIKGLQSPEGFFYSCDQEKKRYEDGDLRFAHGQTFNQAATYRALTVLSRLGAARDLPESRKKRLAGYLDAELGAVRWDICDETEMPVLAFVLNCRSLSGLPVGVDSSALTEYFESWMRWIDSNDPGIEVLDSLALLYRHVRAPISEEGLGTLYDKLCRAVSMSSAAGISVDAVRWDLAYAALDAFGLAADERIRNAVHVEALGQYRNYDGSYLFYDDASTPSYPRETYYAIATLTRMDDGGGALRAVLETADGYIRGELKRADGNAGLMQLFAVKAALLRKLDLKDADVSAFLDRQRQNLARVDYAANYEQVNQLLSVMKEVGAALTENETAKLDAAADEMLERGNKFGRFSDYDSADRLQKCAAYQTKLLIGRPAPAEEVAGYADGLTAYLEDFSSSGSYNPGFAVLLSWNLWQTARAYGIGDEIDWDSLGPCVRQAAALLSYGRGFYKYTVGNAPSWDMTCYVMDLLDDLDHSILNKNQNNGKELP